MKRVRTVLDLGQQVWVLIFAFCGEFQTIRVCREWRNWIPRQWLTRDLGHARLFPTRRILRASVSARDLLGGSTTPLQFCTWLEVRGSDSDSAEDVLGVCATLQNLRHAKLCDFHVPFRLEDPGLAPVHTIELVRCTTMGLLGLDVDVVKIREHRSELPIDPTWKASTSGRPRRTVLLVDDLAPALRSSKVYAWVTPGSAVAGTLVSTLHGTVTVSSCDEQELVLRRQTNVQGEWTFTVLRAPRNTLLSLPDRTFLFFGHDFGHWAGISSDWQPETRPTTVDPTGFTDLTCADGRLFVCHRTLSAAFVVVPFQSWIPTPEPLSRMQYCASEQAFFALGARDSRCLWKFGLAGDLLCSCVCELPDPRFCGQACVLLVTRTYVHVRAPCGSWQDFTFGLKYKDSGHASATQALFEPDNFVRYDGWTPRVGFGVTKETWPLILVSVPSMKVLCSCKVGGVLVMASQRRLVQCRLTSQGYQVCGEPLDLSVVEPRALASLGQTVWMLDSQGHSMAVARGSFVVEALELQAKRLSLVSVLLGLAKLDEHRWRYPESWSRDLCLATLQISDCDLKSTADLENWKLGMRLVLRQDVAAKEQEDKSESFISMGSIGAPVGVGKTIGLFVFTLFVSFVGGLCVSLWRTVSGSSPRRDKMAQAAGEIEGILNDMRIDLELDNV